LTSDGKAGWQINSIEVNWIDGQSVAAADWYAYGIVSTIAAITTFADDDEMGRIGWGLQNTGGVAVAVPYEPIKRQELFEPRVTVQPFIYLGVSSSGTAIANDMIFRINYEIVKLSDIEVLRLLAGGA